MFFLPSARMGLEVPLQAYAALKILYVWHRTITETPMVHCTPNGLICRHKHVKNVLVQHLGELLGVLDLRASKQVKSKQEFPQKRNGVAVKLYSNERLSVFRLLNCETAGATVGFLFRHIAQYRTETVTNPEVRDRAGFRREHRPKE